MFYLISLAIGLQIVSKNQHCLSTTIKRLPMATITVKTHMCLMNSWMRSISELFVWKQSDGFFKMELEMNRIDYCSVGATLPNCMKILPSSRFKEQQRVCIANSSFGIFTQKLKQKNLLLRFIVRWLWVIRMVSCNCFQWKKMRFWYISRRCQPTKCNQYSWVGLLVIWCLNHFFISNQHIVLWF